MGELSYSIALPKSLSADVLVREVHIVINGVERIVKISPDIQDYKVNAKHGDQVSVFVVDIDDAKNVSQPSESLDWLVVDNIAPRTPLKPSLISFEEVSFQEEIIAQHEHCASLPCDECHEHCGQHKHCASIPCDENHEHCGEACFPPNHPC